MVNCIGFAIQWFPGGPNIGNTRGRLTIFYLLTYTLCVIWGPFGFDATRMNVGLGPYSFYCMFFPTIDL